MMAVATPGRLALAQQVKELRERGLIYDQVADRLGISRSYASTLATDPDGAKAAARKDSYRQPCPGCGTLMDGSNGISGSPDHCIPCAGATAKVWTREAIIDAIWDWYVQHGLRAPTSGEWDRAAPDGSHPAKSTVYGSRGPNPSAVFDVNPEHMEVVTSRENTLRGESSAAQRARQTHCVHGHEFTPENTYRKTDGRRQCRACRDVAEAKPKRKLQKRLAIQRTRRLQRELAENTA